MTRVVLKSRTFNRVVVDPTRMCVIKTGEGSTGRQLIELEMQYYECVGAIPGSDRIFPSFVRRCGGDACFEIEYLHQHVPLSVYMESCDDTASVMARVFDQVHRLHSLGSICVDKTTVVNDMKREMIDKVVERYSSIRHAMPTLSRVNGMQIMTFDDVISRMHLYIDRFDPPSTYCIIHGDLNLGNIMVPTIRGEGDIKFIDPRGFFGNTKIYGLPEYDHAKVLFGITGFNRLLGLGGTCFRIDNGDNIVLHDDVYICSKEAQSYMEQASSCVIHLMISIWLAASHYFIEESVEKAIGAHYYAMYLATKYLTEA